MAREERNLYNLEEEGLQEEEADSPAEEDEYEDYVVYHNFYGY